MHYYTHSFTNQYNQSTPCCSYARSYSFASWCNNKPGSTSVPHASSQYTFKMDDEYDPTFSTLLSSKVASCQTRLYKRKYMLFKHYAKLCTDISGKIAYLWICIWISTQCDVYDAIFENDDLIIIKYGST